MDVRAEKLLERKGARIESLETDKGGQVGNHADNGGKARQLMAVRIPSNETTGMTCRIMDIETGIRFRTNGRKVTAPQVIAEKITHRLIDGEKEESFAVRLSRAGDKENHGDKNIAKGDDRLSDGTMDQKKIPYSTGERDWRAKPGGIRAGRYHAGRDAAKLGGWIGNNRKL